MSIKILAWAWLALVASAALYVLAKRTNRTFWEGAGFGLVTLVAMAITLASLSIVGVRP